MPKHVKHTCGNILSPSLIGSILNTIPKKSRKSHKNCILKVRSHNFVFFIFYINKKFKYNTHITGVNGPIVILQTSFLPRAINAAVIL